MYIKHLIGPRKGEVEDIIFDRAKAKVLAGEAEDVYHQMGIAPKPVDVAVGPQVDLAEKVDVPVSVPLAKKKFRR